MKLWPAASASPNAATTSASALFKYSSRETADSGADFAEKFVELRLELFGLHVKAAQSLVHVFAAPSAVR